MLLEKYSLPSEYLRNNKRCFLDPIRNILIQVAPEEIVRQRVVRYLQEELGVPKEMIRLEEPMTYFEKGARGRADIIVYRKEDDILYPVILVECKSPSVELTDDVFEQAVKYDQILVTDAMLLTNGNKLEWYAFHETEERYILLSEAPTYKSLLEKALLIYNMEEPNVWKRPEFQSLVSEETYRQFLDIGWIGEGTGPEIREFIMNLSGCLQDSTDPIVPGDYNEVRVIKDGGIRFTRFGNNAGGSWIGDYRYVLIEDQNKNNQIISLSVIGQMKVEDHPMFGNTKGHSFLIVAIDDFDKSHNSLQLNLDRFTEKDGTSYTITHNGKLANGNKGTASQAVVINFVREHAPELIDENDRVFLGKFDHTRNIVFSDENMKTFLGRVIKYALVRDEFRKASN